MSDRMRTTTDEQLGAAIAALRERIEWPSTPDLAVRAAAAIREPAGAAALVTPRMSLPSRRRALLVIAAALLAIAAAAFAARFVLDLGAVSIEEVPDRPTALPTNVATDTDLGREVTLGRAATIAGFEAFVPTDLGPPDRVWVEEAEVGFEPGGTAARIVSAWGISSDLPDIPGTGVGALLMQFQGEWEVASKVLAAETNRFGSVTVRGHDAFWTTGEHELSLVTGNDARRLLVTGNVLIWQDGRFTFRLETALSKRAAIAVAESVEPADLG